MLWGLKMLLCDFIKNLETDLNESQKLNLILHRLTNNTGPATPTGAGSHAAFLRSKKKKGRQRKKRKSLKAETIKRLSPRSKYYCFSHFRASRIRKFFFSANHGGRQYFSVFHGQFEIHFAGPVIVKIKQVAIKHAALHYYTQIYTNFKAFFQKLL